MLVIGITGPTGSGKTTALHQLTGLGGAIIDCDVVYHEMLDGDLALQYQLEQSFGPLRDGDGPIDRKRLGAIVFRDPKQLQRLNALVGRAISTKVHTLVEQYQAEQAYPAVAIDAIGLFESGLDQLCHTTLAIIAPAWVRVARIMAREGIDEDYAWARVSAQKQDDYYTARCRHVLVNDCPSPQEFGLKARKQFESILAKQED